MPERRAPQDHVNSRAFWLARKRLRLALAVFVVLVATGLLGVALRSFMRQYQATHQVTDHIATTPLTHSTSHPNETPPTDACKAYHVAPNKPRLIRLPSIGVEACIQPVSTDQYNAVAVPSNIYLAGWYVKSAVPGAAGISLIDGHVGGRYRKNAVFSSLDQLAVGDDIAIQMGDGTWGHFTVKKTASYSADEVMKQASQSLSGVSAQLNLITCDGTYTQGTFTNRLLVQAALTPRAQ